MRTLDAGDGEIVLLLSGELDPVTPPRFGTQVVANTPEGRDALYQQYHDWFGERWWMLPNPSYGSWEPALFNNDWAQPLAKRRAAKQAALDLAN